MTKRQFEKYNTAYQSLLKQRYIEKIPENNDTDDNYDLFSKFLFVLVAPEQYEVEPLMLEYVRNHEDATVEELLSYFDSIAPPGLPPCASEWEDDEDEE